jgi:organic hydroperoxide reductase OsmC/OhrA
VGGHVYAARCSWRGSTGEGYERYDRSHRGGASERSLTLTSGDSGRGDPAELNPEELVVMAASSCQLLWFLHLAAKARIDVVSYDDEAEGVMPEDDRPLRLTRIVLRPRIAVRGKVREERVRKLCELAHRECYVANSLTTEISLEPRIESARLA